MLFLGTEAYPEEGAYEEYLSAHGGFTNAFTATEDTNVYFEVDAGALRGALERFSHFFKTPLFSEGATDRELRAVDSENTNNLQADKWRLYQLEKATANPAHPYHKFSTGNLKTLGKPGLREALLAFHDRYYTTPLMKLVVTGREDLDTLERWVAEDFLGVKGGAADTPPAKHLYGVPMHRPEDLGRRVLAVPVKERRSIDLAFPVPLWDTPEAGRYAKPTNYLCHLIGHEGPGSLHALLNKRGWINGLTAGSAFRGDEGAVVKVGMSLTESGMEHLEEVLDLVWEKINMVREMVATAPQQWVFEEMAAMASFQFRFREQGDPSGFASGLSGQLDNGYPPEEVFSGPSQFDDWRPDVLQKFAAALTPANCQLQVVSSSFREQAAAEGWAEEHWYGTQHKLVPFTAEEAARWGGGPRGHPELALPGPNDFIPRDFSLRCDTDAGAAAAAAAAADADAAEAEAEREAPPTLVVAGAGRNATDAAAGMEVWAKLDRTFRVPKATLVLHLGCGQDGWYASPWAMSAARLYTKMLKEELKEYAYDARVAGLRWSVTAEPEGLQLLVSGYSDKLPVLARRVAQAFRQVLDRCAALEGPAPAEGEGGPEAAARRKARAQFEKHRQAMLKDYANFEVEASYQRAMYYARLALEQDAWHISEYAAAVRSPRCTPAAVARTAAAVLGRTQARAFVHGNAGGAEAAALAAEVAAALRLEEAAPLPEGEAKEWRRVALPAGRPVVVEQATGNPREENAAVEVHYQMGVFGEQGDYEKEVLLDLVNQLAYTSAFRQLRTEEQLGYIVSTTTRRSGSPAAVGGFSVIVQGPHHPPAHLDERVEAWLAKFRGELAALSEEEFKQNVEGLVSLKLEKCVRLAEETSQLWAELAAGPRRRDFRRARRQAAQLRALARPQLLAFFDRYLAAGAPERRKLSVQVHAPAHRPAVEAARAARAAAAAAEEPGAGPIYLTDLESIREFKRGAPLYGAAAEEAGYF